MVKKVNVTGLKKAISTDCVVKYYAPWCGYCKQMAPVFDELANQAPSHVHVVKFNMDKHNAEVQEQRVGIDNFGVPVNEDVKGFPTVIMYKKDGTRSLYKGPREVASMLETMKAYYH